MEIFEGACCSLKRHQDLLAKTKAIEEMDTRVVVCEPQDGYWFYVPERIFLDCEEKDEN